MSYPKLSPNSDIKDWVDVVEEFFENEFGIKLFHEYLNTVMGSMRPILFPYEKNELSYKDLEKIVDFFTGEMKMNMLGKKKLKSALNELKNISNKVITLEFYYDISFKINIYVTYVKKDENGIFFLNFIKIKKFGEEMSRLMADVAKEIFKEVDESGGPNSYQY